MTMIMSFLRRLKLSPDLKRKYEITKAEDEFDVATAVRDIGDKQVTPPGFVAGQSHVGVQLFLSKHIVDNPTLSSSYETSVPAQAVEVASVTTVYETSVPAQAVEAASVTTVYETSVA